MRASLSRTAAAAIAMAGGILASGAVRAPDARPRSPLLIAEPFSGLASLRARLDAGARLPADLAGLALTYAIRGDDDAAQRAAAAMAAVRLPPPRSGAWMPYVEASLAYDWLSTSDRFDAASRERVARLLVDAAADLLARPSLSDPTQASYHNHTVRELAIAMFALAAAGEHPAVAARARPLRDRAERAFDNVLEQAAFATPDGGYQESMDYQRLTWAPLALMAELRRTVHGSDPALSQSVFREMAPTYLYKVLPDGSTARDDDNEKPVLGPLDVTVLRYAVHRFKDPYAQWFLTSSGWLPAASPMPVLDFLWDDDRVTPRDPARTGERELSRTREFRGIGHLVWRTGWRPDSTWIQFTAGPYLAKHDHLDANHFVIFHRGHLAIDAGADYTDTESPHYLHHYRRTVAHNTLLVYEPGEPFFWGENLLPAANDGGQRMDSSRFWNSIRSVEDFERTRDLWDRARLEAVERLGPAVHYARGDATRAYRASKLERFVRELVYLTDVNVLFVADRVRLTRPDLRTAWLLHGVHEPRVESRGRPEARDIGQGGTAWPAAERVIFEDGGGRLRVHLVSPRAREVVVRGGPGWEFWTPGDARGGEWGTGRNWPLDPADGGPPPQEPDALHMWRTFYGPDFTALARSNRQAVVPGSWRLEVSPRERTTAQTFLHVLEIGDRETAARAVVPVDGFNLAGAVVRGAPVVLFVTGEARADAAEISLPDGGGSTLVLAGLEPHAIYELQMTAHAAPGAPLWRRTAAARTSGLLRAEGLPRDGGRLRLRRAATSDQARLHEE